MYGVGGGVGDSEHAVSLQGRAYVQLIGWQNTWEQAPGVLAIPSPALMALMARVSPGRVPVHTTLKSRHASRHVINLSKKQCQLRNPTVSALSRPAQAPVVAQQQACERQCPASKLQLWDVDCLLTDCTKELAGLAQPISTAFSIYCNRRISMVSEE